MGIFIFGILAGFFSGVFSTGGPLHVVCLESTVKDIRTFRATMIGLSGVIAVTRIPGLAYTGILHVHHFKMAVFVIPIFLLAQFLGKRTFSKINDEVFGKLLLILLSISGILLML